MNFRLIRILTSVALFTFFMVLLLTLNAHIMYYEEQKHLFLFTWQYATHTIEQEGLLNWLSYFIIQFYHIPWFGAAILSAMLTGTYLLFESIIKKITGMRDFLQLGIIPAIHLYFTLNKIDSTPGMLIAAFLSLAALRLLFSVIPSLSRKSGTVPDSARLKPIPFAIPLVIAGICLGIAYHKAESEFNIFEHGLIMAGKATKERDWDKVTEISENILTVQPNNKLMIYLRCLAYANRGILLEKLFDYPMTDGVHAITFNWENNARLAEFGQYVPEYIGSINDATHWAFESLSAWGENAPNLINLAKYNIALGKPKVAWKFVNKLKHSLFYRDKAASLKRQILGLEPPEVHCAFTPDSINSSRLIQFNPIRNLKEIVEADPSNGIARQYFLASLLLANDQDELAANLDPGKPLPGTVQQAMLIYSLYPDAKPLDSLGIEIPQNVRDEYARYSTAVRKKDSMTVKNQFGNTFWHYIGNICPYGLRKQSSLSTNKQTAASTLEH